MAGTGILGIIIGKFSYKIKPCLIILFDIDKNQKVGFYYAIHSLSLAICL